MRRLSSTAVAALLLVALVGCSSTSGTGGGGGDTNFVAGDGTVNEVPIAERKPAPAISAPTLEGDTLELASLAGQVVVLNVWASWCGPCRGEAPTLERVARDLESEGVAFVGINTRDQLAAAQATQRTWGISYPSWVDRDGELQLLFRDTLPPTAIPSTLVIDRSGRIAARVVGPVSEGTLRSLLEPVMAEAA